MTECGDLRRLICGRRMRTIRIQDLRDWEPFRKVALGAFMLKSL